LVKVQRVETWFLGRRQVAVGRRQAPDHQLVMVQRVETWFLGRRQAAGGRLPMMSGDAHAVAVKFALGIEAEMLALKDHGVHTSTAST
jgi:hypothetical protein